LVNIDREKRLQKALSSRDTEHQTGNSKDTPKTNLTPATSQVENNKHAAVSIANPARLGAAQHDSTDLPEHKIWGAFISHKKMHTKFADSSETMAIRLKVNLHIIIIHILTIVVFDIFSCAIVFLITSCDCCCHRTCCVMKATMPTLTATISARYRKKSWRKALSSLAAWYVFYPSPAIIYIIFCDSSSSSMTKLYHQNGAGSR
jgi:hypothetical protein